MEKIEAADFNDDMLLKAEKHCYMLIRQSVIPLWKATPLYREAMKQHGVKDLNELRAIKYSKRTHSKSQIEIEVQVEAT